MSAWTIGRRAAAVLLGVVAVAAPGTAADVKVAQRDRAFWPNQITVKVGDRIIFANEDEVTHNVVSTTKGLQFEIRSQQPGQSDLVRFMKPGVLEVQCAIHPRMKMTVTVSP